jgi:hypothetical protein
MKYPIIAAHPAATAFDGLVIRTMPGIFIGTVLQYR